MQRIPNLEFQDIFETQIMEILLGILGVKEEWYVSSNQESGEGYSDILVETENSETVILIEVKYANDGNFHADIRNPLRYLLDSVKKSTVRMSPSDSWLRILLLLSPP